MAPLLLEIRNVRRSGSDASSRSGGGSEKGNRIRQDSESTQEPFLPLFLPKLT